MNNQDIEQAIQAKGLTAPRAETAGKAMALTQQPTVGARAQ